ncbi:MAG: glycosyltransferase family 39 protein [Anaerolineales bacterium]|nr:glycosyltransferase family 39 protein [Anaerolineales bacterium]
MSNTGKKFVLILLLAIVLRTTGIISRPIWYDEAFSVLFSEKGPEAMIYGTLSETGTGSADIHPLGYYSLLWVWINIFGNSIFAARALSIAISLISLALIYKIAELLFDGKTALLAAAIFATLPFQVHFAQEIRMYGLLAMLLLLSTFAFLRARADNWKWWGVFALSSALAQYTHNLAAFYLIPLALTPLFQKDWKTLRSLTAAGLVSIIMYLPWAIHLPAQFSKVSASYWVERPGLEKIFTLFLYYLPNMPLPNNMLVPGLLLATFTITLAAFQTVLAGKAKAPASNRGIWLVYLAFTPPLLLWLISQFVPVYIERALLPSHAIFCIWLAWTLTQTKAPRPIQMLMAFFIAAGSILGFSQHITYKNFPYGPFDIINKTITSEFQAGDVVIHSSKLSYLPSLYFNSGLPQGYIIDPPGTTVDTLAPATQEILNLTEYEDISTATANFFRIWFIIYQKSIDEYTEGEYSNHPHLEYLDSQFTLQSIKKQDGITIYLYSRISP